MFLEVVKAEYLNGYRIKLWFNNQVVKIVDLANSLNGEVFLPLKDMKELFGDFDPQPGYRFLGNFYKCGDETPAEHYLSWHPITSAGPDFHRPECFGTLEIAAQ